MVVIKNSIEIKNIYFSNILTCREIKKIINNIYEEFCYTQVPNTIWGLNNRHRNNNYGGVIKIKNSKICKLLTLESMKK